MNTKLYYLCKFQPVWEIKLICKLKYEVCLISTNLQRLHLEQMKGPTQLNTDGWSQPTKPAPRKASLEGWTQTDSLNRQSQHPEKQLGESYTAEYRLTTSTD